MSKFCQSKFHTLCSGILPPDQEDLSVVGREFMALNTNCEDPRRISQEFERERDELEEIAEKGEIDSDVSILQS